MSLVSGDCALSSGNAFSSGFHLPFEFFVGLFGFVNVLGRFSSSDALDLAIYDEVVARVVVSLFDITFVLFHC